MKKNYFYLLFIMILISLNGANLAQETIIIQDNLAGSTVGAQVGGSFSVDGYKPGVGSGHILYDVPSQVVNGYVEFQFKGFSHAALPTDADNGFIGLYDGRGITEQILYFNDFKENFFRWNFHWRQNRVNFKGLISCAEPTADRLNATKAVYTLANSPEDPNFPGQPERDWSSEPNGSGWSWNESTWYTLRIEWNNKAFSAKVNGTTVWSTSGPYDYAPIDFKIWLGSAPGYGVKYTCSLPNLVYRNFKLVSYGGVPQNSAPVITSSAVTSGLVGQLYSYDVGASGNPTPSYSLTTSPSGMTINSTSGLILWTPSATGNFNVTVKAANGVSPDATQSFTINVQSQVQNTAPVITSTEVTDGTVGRLYTYDVNASGNPTPTYSLTTFPSGMTINSSSGLIQWMPSAAGNVNVTVKAANGVSPDATQSFTINVQPAGNEFIVLQDNLQGSTIGAQVGGSFSSEGYKPGVGNNHILYDVPSQVVNGYIEFQIKGFSHALVQDPEGDAENGFAGLYDGRGIAEPIAYFNNFKYNFFRWNLHWRQELAKFKNTIMCAAPTPSRLNDTKAVYTLLNSPDDGAGNPVVDWTSAPTGSGWNWDADTWYTIRMEWEDKSFQVLVDDIQVLTTSGPYVYAPIDFKIWIGSAPGLPLQNTVQNIVYRNFKLVDFDQMVETAPSFTSSPIMVGGVGQLYSYDANASGYPAPAYSLTTYPSGMTIDTTTGQIEWIPNAIGNYDVTVVAANGVSPDATQSFTISVLESIACPGSMISYWKFDETSGNSYFDYIGANNATSASVPTPAAGRVNGGQQFNGTSNKITAPRIAAYDFTASSSFTFETWIKHPTSATPVLQQIIGRKNTTDQLSVWLGFDNSTEITFSVRSKTGELYVISGPNLLDNNWHHVVAVKDGALNQLRLYVDGNLSSTIAATFSSGFDSPTAIMSIGYRDISGDNRYFNGLIDELAIYNSALDLSTAAKHYNNGLLNYGYCETLTAPAITSTPSVFVPLNQQYSYDVEATGFPVPKYSLVTFPSGMTIDSLSGVIEWTPAVSGNFDVAVLASNGVIPAASQSYTLRVRDLLNAPSALEAVLNPADTQNVRLTWTDNSSNEFGFVIERKLGDTTSVELFVVIDSVAADVSVYEDTSLADTTMYTYRVYAFNADTMSEYSNQSQIKSAVPVELTSFKANVIRSQVIIEWETATEINNAGFSLQRSKENGNFIDIAFIKGNGTTTDKSVYSFVDKTALTGKYGYRLKQIDLDGSVNYSKVILVDLGVVKEFSLDQNYPNPFNPSTTIRFAVPIYSKVEIVIYNQLGEMISQPINRFFEQGYYEVNVSMENLSSGVYFYRIKAGEFSQIKKMILTK